MCILLHQCYACVIDADRFWVSAGAVKGAGVSHCRWGAGPGVPLLWSAESERPQHRDLSWTAVQSSGGQGPTVMGGSVSASRAAQDHETEQPDPQSDLGGFYTNQWHI